MRRESVEHETESHLEYEARLKADGFTLFDEAKPEIGKAVEAVRVFQSRGFGGVILRTERKIAPVIRESDYAYTDTLNNDRVLASSEFEGWRELQTYAEQRPALTAD